MVKINYLKKSSQNSKLLEIITRCYINVNTNEKRNEDLKICLQKSEFRKLILKISFYFCFFKGSHLCCH